MPAGTSVDAATGLVAFAGQTDGFSGISSFVGSTSGSTTFIAASIGGYSFAGQGSANIFDLGALPAGSAVFPATGLVTFAGQSDSFSDVSSFVGSTSGSTTFAAPPTGGETFTGRGTGNSLDLSALPAGASLTPNGDSPGSPGVLAKLATGPGGASTDSFVDVTSFVGFAGEAITSVDTTTASLGQHFSFLVTTTGAPTPTLRRSGKLPKGITFVDDKNGTATLSGTPGVKTPASFSFLIKATFGTGKSKVVVTQTFTFTFPPT